MHHFKTNFNLINQNGNPLEIITIPLASSRRIIIPCILLPKVIRYTHMHMYNTLTERIRILEYIKIVRLIRQHGLHTQTHEKMQIESEDYIDVFIFPQVKLCKRMN